MQIFGGFLHLSYIYVCGKVDGEARRKGKEMVLCYLYKNDDDISLNFIIKIFD